MTSTVRSIKLAHIPGDFFNFEIVSLVFNQHGISQSASQILKARKYTAVGNSMEMYLLPSPILSPPLKPPGSGQSWFEPCCLHEAGQSVLLKPHD